MEGLNTMRTIHLTTGRRIELPDAKEEAAINAGIAADPDTYELSEEEFAQLCPLGQDQKKGRDS